MAEVRVSMSEERDSCRLPQICLKCLNDAELNQKIRTFRASSLLQLLAILPWFALGANFKTSPGSILIALAMSIGICFAAAQSLEVEYSICQTCSAQYKKKQLCVAVLLLIGVGMLAASPSNPNLLILGPLCLLVAIGLQAHVSSYSLRLLRKHGEEAVLSVPNKDLRVLL